MPTVTALRAARRDRVAVELDGVAWRTLPLEAVVCAGLSVGTQLDRGRARVLRRELRRIEALAVSVNALRRRSLSARTLETRLEQRGVASAERAEAIATLERAGLVDDRRFAEGRARMLAERGRGNDAIRWELEQGGIGNDLAEQALTTLEPEAARAERIVARRGGGVATARFLLARGFGEDTVEHALEGVVGTGGETPIR